MILWLAILLQGCAAQPPQTGEKSPRLESCSDPRPQICTREYNPVCARLDDGTWMTYATGCTACADKAVVGWRAGACAQ